MYIYIYIYTHVSCIVSACGQFLKIQVFNFLQSFKLRVSNPRTAAYAYFNMPFESSNLPGAGPIFSKLNFWKLAAKHGMLGAEALYPFSSHWGYRGYFWQDGTVCSFKTKCMNNMLKEHKHTNNKRKSYHNENNNSNNDIMINTNTTSGRTARPCQSWSTTATVWYYYYHQN